MNIASRMESTGVPGRIHVTKDVVAFAEHEFIFESRGKVLVKGKGEMATFFLKKAKKLESRRSLLVNLETRSSYSLSIPH